MRNKILSFVREPSVPLALLLILALAVIISVVWGTTGTPTTTTQPTTPPTLTSLPTLPPPSTTTPPSTVPPTTAPPTTTSAPTTTLSPTTVPPTTLPPTSTTAPPVQWPSAIGCRQNRIPRWDFYVATTIGGNPNGEPWWLAQYCRQLPFVEGHTISWPDGDRSGYRCGYAPLELDGEVVGRVWFVRGANYVGLTDDGMTEGQRWFDGSPADVGREIGDCPEPRTPYEPLPVVTDERPIIAYVHNDLGPLEVRDYRGTGIFNSEGQIVPSPIIARGDLRFRLISFKTEPFTDRGAHPDAQPHTVYSEAAVAAYTQLEDGQWWPGFLVYYSSLHPDVEMQVRFSN